MGEESNEITAAIESGQVVTDTSKVQDLPIAKTEESAPEARLLLLPSLPRTSKTTHKAVSNPSTQSNRNLPKDQSKRSLPKYH